MEKDTVTLRTGDVNASKDNRLVIFATGKTGKVWLSLVSLFPPTYNDRPNGNRIDLMQKLADMRPGFLRFPGGNYLEGNTIPDASPGRRLSTAWRSGRDAAARGATALRTGWGCWSSSNGART